MEQLPVMVVALFFYLEHALVREMIRMQVI